MVNSAHSLIVKAHDSEEIRENLILLCAKGYSDADVAEHMLATGLIEQATAKDIKYWRQLNIETISACAEREAKKIIASSIRMRKPYRVAELDRLLGQFAELIPEWLNSKPQVGARLMSVYLQGSRQLAEEVGDMKEGGGTTNNLVVILQDATPEERRTLQAKMADVAQFMEQIQNSKKLSGPTVIDAEYE